MLARRSRRTLSSPGNIVSADCLECVSYGTATVALCFLLAVNFYAGQLHRAHLLRYLASSNCSTGDTNRTILPPTVRSSLVNRDDPALSQDHLSSLIDPAIKQRFQPLFFMLNNNLSVLQSPVDMELSVVRRNAKVLLLSHLRANSSFSFTFSEP